MTGAMLMVLGVVFLLGLGLGAFANEAAWMRQMDRAMRDTRSEGDGEIR